jgi:hypothetical protein
MSYLIDDEKVTPPVKKRDHRGKLNPHYNCPMSQDSRNAIAQSQKARFDYYRKAAANIMTEDRVREIIKETIDNYLAKNTTELKNNNRPNNIPL